MLLKGTKDGCFSIKCFYGVLDRSVAVLFPHCIIWNTWTPTKVGFFAWEASLGKVLTLDYLKRRGRILANRCFLYEEEEESIDQLLVQCSKAKVLWDLLLGLVGASWVFPRSIRETLLSWSGTFIGKRRKKVWMAAPLHFLDYLA